MSPAFGVFFRCSPRWKEKTSVSSPSTSRKYIPDGDHRSAVADRGTSMSSKEKQKATVLRHTVVDFSREYCFSLNKDAVDRVQSFILRSFRIRIRKMIWNKSLPAIIARIEIERRFLSKVVHCCTLRRPRDANSWSPIISMPLAVTPKYVLDTSTSGEGVSSNRLRKKLLILARQETLRH